VRCFPIGNPSTPHESDDVFKHAALSFVLFMCIDESILFLRGYTFSGSAMIFQHGYIFSLPVRLPELINPAGSDTLDTGYFCRFKLSPFFLPDNSPYPSLGKFEHAGFIKVAGK
jgi:hypothetical protein